MFKNKIQHCETMKKIIPLLIGLVTFYFQNQAQTIKDLDGNIYDTVRIGTQTWMKKNLQTTKYKNGTAIPLVTDNSTWKKLTTPAYCNYNNTLNTDTINTYGRLYNWFTINTGKLCPTGWHVSTNAEWTRLTDYLGGDSTAGRKLKEAGTKHWISPLSTADNSSGFTALPSGKRSDEESFGKMGYNSYWWTSTEADFVDFVWFRYLFFDNSVISFFLNKQNGFSVRCVKN